MSAERRDRLLSCLPDSGLPADLAAWLRHGLEVQSAGGDLLASLELGGPDTDRRDDLLRTVIALSPGEYLGARCAFVVACLMGDEQHPRKDMQNIIRRLRLAGCRLSVRQLRRVVKHRRQDGYRVQENDINGRLCHEQQLLNNWPIIRRTGT